MKQDSLESRLHPLKHPNFKVLGNDKLEQQIKVNRMQLQFNFENIFNKYENIKPSGVEVDLTTFDVYVPESMSAREAQKHIRKITGMGEMFGKTPMAADCNDAELLSDDEELIDICEKRDKDFAKLAKLKFGNSFQHWKLPAKKTLPAITYEKPVQAAQQRRHREPSTPEKSDADCVQRALDSVSFSSGRPSFAPYREMSGPPTPRRSAPARMEMEPRKSSSYRRPRSPNRSMNRNSRYEAGFRDNRNYYYSGNSSQSPEPNRRPNPKLSKNSTQLALPSEGSRSRQVDRRATYPVDRYSKQNRLGSRKMPSPSYNESPNSSSRHGKYYYYSRSPSEDRPRYYPDEDSASESDQSNLPSPDRQEYSDRFERDHSPYSDVSGPTNRRPARHVSQFSDEEDDIDSADRNYERRKANKYDYSRDGSPSMIDEEFYETGNIQEIENKQNEDQSATPAPKDMSFESASKQQNDTTTLAILPVRRRSMRFSNNNTEDPQYGSAMLAVALLPKKSPKNIAGTSKGVSKKQITPKSLALVPTNKKHEVMEDISAKLAVVPKNRQQSGYAATSKSKNPTKMLAILPPPRRSLRTANKEAETPQIVSKNKPQKDVSTASKSVPKKPNSPKMLAILPAPRRSLKTANKKGKISEVISAILAAVPMKKSQKGSVAASKSMSKRQIGTKMLAILPAPRRSMRLENNNTEASPAQAIVPPNNTLKRKSTTILPSPPSKRRPKSHDGDRISSRMTVDEENEVEDEPSKPRKPQTWWMTTCADMMSSLDNIVLSKNKASLLCSIKSSSGQSLLGAYLGHLDDFPPPSTRNRTSDYALKEDLRVEQEARNRNALMLYGFKR